MLATSIELAAPASSISPFKLEMLKFSFVNTDRLIARRQFQARDAFRVINGFVPHNALNRPSNQSNDPYAIEGTAVVALPRPGEEKDHLISSCMRISAQDTRLDIIVRPPGVLTSQAPYSLFDQGDEVLEAYGLAATRVTSLLGPIDRIGIVTANLLPQDSIEAANDDAYRIFDLVKNRRSPASTEVLITETLSTHIAGSLPCTINRTLTGRGLTYKPRGANTTNRPDVSATSLVIDTNSALRPFKAFDPKEQIELLGNLISQHLRIMSAGSVTPLLKDAHRG